MGKTTRNKGGRPVEIGAAVLKRIAKTVEEGNYLETAANLEGVDPSSVGKLLRAGMRELHRMAKAGEAKPARELARAVGFARLIRTARAKAEKKDLGAIAKSGKWQAHAWRLKHRDPKRYADHVEVTGKGGGPITSVSMTADQLRRLSDAELRTLEAIAAKLAADGEAAGADAEAE